MRRLRESYERYYRRNTSSLRNGDVIDSVVTSCDVDGNVAATVLKQYLRELPTSLILDQVMKISNQLKCSADENFAIKTRYVVTSYILIR